MCFGHSCVSDTMFSTIVKIKVNTAVYRRCCDLKLLSLRVFPGPERNAPNPPAV